MAEKQTQLVASENLSELDLSLLNKIADIEGEINGAYNIRKDTGCSGRANTENITITSKEDGHAGIDIRIKDGTKNECCHIPVIITESGIEETVYNDFYIGDDCDITVIAGCGISNCGQDASRHDGIHAFHIGKNSRVKYLEKHYGEGDGSGERVMNPETLVDIGENSVFDMETSQIAGVDSTERLTTINCAENAEVIVTERLLTHGRQHADSRLDIRLNGENSKGRVVSRSVGQGESVQNFYPNITGNAACFGHVQCDSIIMDSSCIASIPAITANHPEAQLIHEAAIGRIAGDQLLKMQTLGLTEEEAEERILKGFLA
ncbi:MAG: SufD family Fe-S cluster assembly protein [Oscillospiraceae bacterium]|nr:SufD family Fe-S cluster assembly protein [Oscillospiraceae bacterium]